MSVVHTRRELSVPWVHKSAPKFRKLLGKIPKFVENKEFYRNSIIPIAESGTDYQVCYFASYVYSLSKGKTPEVLLPENWEDEYLLGKWEDVLLGEL